MPFAGALAAFGTGRAREPAFFFFFGVPSGIASPVRFGEAGVRSLAGVGPGDRCARPCFARLRPPIFGAGASPASALAAIARPLRLSFVVLSSVVARGMASPLSKRRACKHDATRRRTADRSEVSYRSGMRKQVIADDTKLADTEWLDLDAVATVEVSSEDPAHPVEAALIDTAAGAAGDGWRASVPGEQFLRLRFDTPRRLTRISILFVEHAAARTQEFAITWSADGREYREIVRQQWNFNPAGSTRELEDYRVALDAVSALQVTVRPDIGDRQAVASIARLRVA
jgi:hypothetical protein